MTIGEAQLLEQWRPLMAIPQLAVVRAGGSSRSSFISSKLGSSSPIPTTYAVPSDVPRLRLAIGGANTRRGGRGAERRSWEFTSYFVRATFSGGLLGQSDARRCIAHSTLCHTPCATWRDGWNFNAHGFQVLILAVCFPVGTFTRSAHLSRVRSTHQWRAW